MSKSFLNIFLMVVALLAVLSAASTSTFAQAQTIVFVDANSTNVQTPSAGNPGNTWAAAYKFLQDGLTRAAVLSGGTNNIQVWVRGEASATGLVYRPDQSSANTTGTNLRTATFSLKPNIRIYGGFAGNEPATQAGFELRQPNVNRTTLTGEIDDPALRSDNCYHVVTAQSTSVPHVLVDSTARLDGFWVTAGNANGVGTDQDWGGGILVRGAQPVVQNTVFTDNDATAGGGGHAEGICGSLSDPPLLTTHPEFRSCAFIGNRAGAHAAWCNNRDFTTFINCVFRGNISSGASGAIVTTGGGGLCQKTINLINCTLSLNTAATSGGAINNFGTVNMHNSIVWNNSAPTDPNLGGTGTYNITYSDVQSATPPGGDRQYQHRPQVLRRQSATELSHAHAGDRRRGRDNPPGHLQR